MALGILERPVKDDAADALQQLKDENPNIGSLEGLSGQDVSEVRSDDPMLDKYNESTREIMTEEFDKVDNTSDEDKKLREFMSTKRIGMSRGEEKIHNDMENYSDSTTAEPGSVIKEFSSSGPEKASLPPKTQKLGEVVAVDQVELTLADEQ